MNRGKRIKTSCNLKHTYFFFLALLVASQEIALFFRFRVVIKIAHFSGQLWEHSGSVVECLTRDRGAAGLSLTGVTVVWPLARHIYPCLVLVQPRKTRPDITERLLTGT